MSVQKAHEEVEKAKLLSPEFNVMQGVIKTERELEGARRSPMTADFGTRSEAAQYSGRHVDDAWKCPFHPRTHQD